MSADSDGDGGAIEQLRQLDERELSELVRIAKTSAADHVSRRDVMKMAGTGALSFAAGTAAAAPSTSDGYGDIGSTTNPSDAWLHATQHMSQGTAPTSNGEMRNVNGNLEAYSGGARRNLSEVGTVGVEEAATTVLDAASSLDFQDSGFNVVDDGDGTVTIENAASAGSGKPYNTVVVAASDAKSTSGADYVCDGTDDQAEINSAITAVHNAGGGMVKLTEGTYNIGVSATNVGRSSAANAGVYANGVNNVWLSGQGVGTSLRLNASTQANVVEIDGCNNCGVENVHVDGNGANQTDGGENENQCGINAYNSSGITVRKSYVIDTGYANLRFNRSGYNMRNIHVVDNILDTTNFSTEVASNGVALAGEANNDAWQAVVANNVIRNQAWAGVEIAQGWTNVEVTGNSIYSTSSDGSSGVNPHPKPAEATHGGHVAITGNSITRVGGTNSDGIAADFNENVVIAGNTVADATRHGVHFGFGGGDAPVITGNIFRNCSTDGIHGYGGSGGVISGNRASGNGGSGIALDSGCDSNVVVANNVDGISNSGTGNELAHNL